MKHALASLFFASFVLPATCAVAPAQVCGAGATLLKNDILPANPTGKYTYGVVPGLCANEAAMSYFKYGTPCNVNSVSILFGHGQGTNGAKAIVDVEIYDGATFSGAKVTLGKLLFKLSAGGSTLQIQTNGINTFALPKAVRVPSGNPVIGFRMLQNFSGGSCALGYNANFSCDAENKCRPGINILHHTNAGWPNPLDPAVFRVPPLSFPFCPTFFRGSWVIRACVTPDVSITWTGNPTPGGVISFQLNAPRQAGNGYYLLMSGGTKTGWQSPWGKLPLDRDWVFDCFLADCAPALVNRNGRFNASSQAFGGLLIPNSPILKNSGLKLYAGFVTYKHPNLFPWVSVSAPSQVITIN